MAGRDVVELQADFARFQRDLRRLEPETRKALNKQLRQFGKTILVPAARAAASWSTRIPKAIGMSVTAKRMAVRVSSKRAPHARPYEGISGPVFRHPVFGNRSVWVSQQARPFLLPAVEAKRDEFLEAAGKAVDEAAMATGWKGRP